MHSMTCCLPSTRSSQPEIEEGSSSRRLRGLDCLAAPPRFVVRKGLGLESRGLTVIGIIIILILITIIVIGIIISLVTIIIIIIIIFIIGGIIK